MIRFEDVGINRKENVLKIGVASPFFLHSSDSIFSAVDKILEKGYRRLPIVSKKKELEGIVTYTDILDAFLRREDFKQPISTIMVREVIFCEKDDTLEKAVQRMKLSRRGGLPILSGRKLVGIITERDVLKRFEEKEFGIKVSEFMTKKPFFFRPMLSILDVARTIVSTKYRRFPVVEEGKVVGIITAVDVLKYIKKNEFKLEALDEEMERIMKKDVYTVLEEDDLSVAIKEMKEKDVGGLVVVDEEKNLKGIITERDIIDKLV